MHTEAHSVNRFATSIVPIDVPGQRRCGSPVIGPDRIDGRLDLHEVDVFPARIASDGVEVLDQCKEQRAQPGHWDRHPASRSKRVLARAQLLFRGCRNRGVSTDEQHREYRARYALSAGRVGMSGARLQFQLARIIHEGSSGKRADAKRDGNSEARGLALPSAAVPVPLLRRGQAPRRRVPVPNSMSKG